MFIVEILTIVRQETLGEPEIREPIHLIFDWTPHTWSAEKREMPMRHEQFLLRSSRAMLPPALPTLFYSLSFMELSIVFQNFPHFVVGGHATLCCMINGMKHFWSLEFFFISIATVNVILWLIWCRYYVKWRSRNSSLFCQAKVKLVTLLEGYPKAPFPIATTPRCREGRYYIPWNGPLFLEPYHIMLNAKQCLMYRLFINSPGDQGSIPGRIEPKTQEMVLEIVLLNTQYYKVRMKGKVEQSRE